MFRNRETLRVEVIMFMGVVKEPTGMLLNGIFEMVYRGEISLELALDYFEREHYKAEGQSGTLKEWLLQGYYSWKEEKIISGRL